MKQILFIFIWLFTGPIVFADTVQLKSGKVIEGEIVEKTETYIKVDTGESLLKIQLNHLDQQTVAEIKGESKRLEPPKTAPVNAVGTVHEAEKKTVKVNGSGDSGGIALDPEQMFNRVANSVVVINVQKEDGGGLGSGFIVSSNGMIVTNYHVVDGATRIQVKLYNGKVFDVSSVGDCWISLDVCILKIEADDLPAIALNETAVLNPGQAVYVVGAPLGYDYSITAGLYSALRNFDDHVRIQFSAPISSGNSGGPLFDVQGRVVGIVTFMLVEGQNMNFAIPVAEFKHCLKGPLRPVSEFVSYKHRDAVKAYGEALEAYRNGWLGTAIDALEASLQYDPEFLDSFTALINVYFELERMDQASALSRQYVQSRPHDPLAWMLQGNILLQNDAAQALKAYQKALDLRPNWNIAMRMMGEAYFSAGQTDEAVSWLEKAAATPPSHEENLMRLAHAYYELEYFDYAQRVLERSVAEFPGCWGCHLGLAHVLKRQGFDEEAMQHIKRILESGGELSDEDMEHFGLSKGGIQLYLLTDDWKYAYDQAKSMDQLPHVACQAMTKAVEIFHSDKDQDKQKVMLALASSCGKAAEEFLTEGDDINGCLTAKKTVQIMEESGGLGAIIEFDKRVSGWTGTMMGTHVKNVDEYVNPYVIMGKCGYRDLTIGAYQTVQEAYPEAAERLKAVIPNQ